MMLTNSSTAYLSQDRDRCSASLIALQVTLDALAERFRAPDLIKIDTKGAEVLACTGARRLLSSKDPPRLLLAVHGPDRERGIMAILQSYGYGLYDLSNHRVAQNHNPKHITHHRNSQARERAAVLGGQVVPRNLPVG